MRQKKFETRIKNQEIRSYGFSPPPPNPLHQKQHMQIQSQLYPQNQTLTHLQIHIPTPPSSLLRTHHQQPHFHFHHEQEQPISNHPSTPQQQKPLLPTSHRTPTIMALSPSSSLSHSPAFHQSYFSTKSKLSTNPFAISFSIKTLAYKLFFHFSHARLLCVHLRVLVLISLPSFYFLSNPHRFVILNFLSILAFSITVLVSLNLALPRLPSIRLLLARSLPNKLNSTPLPTKSSKPVIWSIGSKPKVEKKPNSGSWVQVYSNGEVYEGEFHKGKCSGSGVYYYYLSGRYEGDWIDEKYDGYGVETWARGSRYRGQYRQGLRHGIGVYRFYTGDVYAGEWSNGQCHGCGIHTCEDGSRYVGEFKWGVKHGLGHYHFR